MLVEDVSVCDRYKTLTLGGFLNVKWRESGVTRTSAFEAEARYS